MAESGSVVSALDAYHQFLTELDTWFRSIRVKYGARMRCGEGCTLCCRGLFDVPIADAIRVAAGFNRLSSSTREGIVHCARTVHAELLEEAPELEEPYFLDRLSEDRIDRLADRFGDTPCPFLTAGGGCFIYEFRPSACILEGIPMVDIHDGLFDDWCEFNFAGGISGEVERDLRQDYYEIEATVRRASENLAAQMPSPPQEEATVFIPSVVVAFENYRQKLLPEKNLKTGANTGFAPSQL